MLAATSTFQTRFRRPLGASEFVGTNIPHIITRLLEGGIGRIPSMGLVVAMFEAIKEPSRGGVGHLAPGGVGLLHKGRHADAELGEAHRNWSFDLTRHQSATDVSGTILEIRRLDHAA